VPTGRDLNDRAAVDEPPALGGEAKQPTARNRLAVIVRQHEDVAAGAVAAFDVQPLGARHAETANRFQAGQPAHHGLAAPPHLDELEQPARWQHCRAYKIVGAQGTLDADGADSLWRYQSDLVAAARKQDGAAALSVSEASLENATQRIRALLAAQKDEESTGALRPS
jgi:hypothetical protein